MRRSSLSVTSAPASGSLCATGADATPRPRRPQRSSKSCPVMPPSCHRTTAVVAIGRAAPSPDGLDLADGCRLPRSGEAVDHLDRRAPAAGGARAGARSTTVAAGDATPSGSRCRARRGATSSLDDATATRLEEALFTVRCRSPTGRSKRRSHARDPRRAAVVVGVTFVAARARTPVAGRAGRVDAAGLCGTRAHDRQRPRCGLDAAGRRRATPSCAPAGSARGPLALARRCRRRAPGSRRAVASARCVGGRGSRGRERGPAAAGARGLEDLVAPGVNDRSRSR